MCSTWQRRVLVSFQRRRTSHRARVPVWVPCRVASCLVAGSDDAIDYTVVSFRASVSCLVVTLLIVCVVPIWIYLHRFLELLVCDMNLLYTVHRLKVVLFTDLKIIQKTYTVPSQCYTLEFYRTCNQPFNCLNYWFLYVIPWVTPSIAHCDVILII